MSIKSQTWMQVFTAEHYQYVLTRWAVVLILLVVWTLWLFSKCFGVWKNQNVHSKGECNQWVFLVSFSRWVFYKLNCLLHKNVIVLPVDTHQPEYEHLPGVSVSLGVSQDFSLLHCSSQDSSDDSCVLLSSSLWQDDSLSSLFISSSSFTSNFSLLASWLSSSMSSSFSGRLFFIEHLGFISSSDGKVSLAKTRYH